MTKAVRKGAVLIREDDPAIAENDEQVAHLLAFLGLIAVRLGNLCVGLGRSSVFVLPLLSGAVVGARLASPPVWKSAWWLVGGPVLGADSGMGLRSIVSCGRRHRPSGK
jgi:hypothetical protein